jgi:hypothetical protein
VIKAARFGAVLGAVTLVLLFGLSRLGSAHAAHAAAEASLLVAMAMMIGVLTLGKPLQMRKARVPMRRAVPPQWWPPETDSAPVVALCLGGPIVVACATGVVLFH